ncbi:hypothetical protein ACIP5Y_12735 [Nocardia sp. NPDC088792]|uniref:hypothetical protein n=1 Tax=Nocardia sp. NPDC088792 TaxID=3364332 RepID=UPI00380B9B8B
MAIATQSIDPKLRLVDLNTQRCNSIRSPLCPACERDLGASHRFLIVRQQVSFDEKGLPMSVIVVFLAGFGVGCMAMWLLQTLHAADDDSVHSSRENDLEYWSVRSIRARIAEENPSTARSGHRSRAAGPSSGARTAGGWPTTASAR